MSIFETIEKAYTSKEVADIIESTQSTVNRWALELEKCGYIFVKDDNNIKRLFLEADIEVYKTLKKLVDETNMNTEKACKLVVENYKDTLLTQRAVSTQVQETSTEVQIQPNQYAVSDYVEILEQKQNQMFLEMETRLSEQLHQQEQRAIERENEREERYKERAEQRDRLLLESIRTLQQQKEQQAKKSFWARLFGK